MVWKWGARDLLEAAQPHIALHRAHAAFDRKLSAVVCVATRPCLYTSYYELGPATTMATPTPGCPCRPPVIWSRETPSASFFDNRMPSSRYNYQLKWWWDLVVVSAAYNRESMARLQQATSDWLSPGC